MICKRDLHLVRFDNVQSGSTALNGSKKHTAARACLEAIELVVSDFRIDVAIKSRTHNPEFTSQYTLKEIKAALEERKNDNFIVLGNRTIPLNYLLDLSKVRVHQYSREI